MLSFSISCLWTLCEIVRCAAIHLCKCEKAFTIRRVAACESAYQSHITNSFICSLIRSLHACFVWRWFAASMLRLTACVAHSFTQCLTHSVHTHIHTLSDSLWTYLFRLWVLIRWMLNKQFGHTHTHTQSNTLTRNTTPKTHKLVATTKHHQ